MEWVSTLGTIGKGVGARACGCADASPVLKGWTCARDIVGWRMLRGERVGNGVDQHQMTNGAGCRPWNHQERSWGMCLRMCPRAACAARAEWVDMCNSFPDGSRGGNPLHWLYDSVPYHVVLSPPTPCTIPQHAPCTCPPTQHGQHRCVGQH